LPNARKMMLPVVSRDTHRPYSHYHSLSKKEDLRNRGNACT
jgi:hypothetical protein